ncbi:hypothetical protein SpCBS45565_g05979 [Spizellomyces sp. 'palustris']|nr:hypothetical protein SpCBS45565_g05979 [Spizellomyces sp. 'palustris']
MTPGCPCQESYTISPTLLKMRVCIQVVRC